jgi:hypothetical protein
MKLKSITWEGVVSMAVMAVFVASGSLAIWDWCQRIRLEPLRCTQRRLRAIAIAVTAYTEEYREFPEPNARSMQKALEGIDYKTAIQSSSGITDWRPIDCFGRNLEFRRLSSSEMLVISTGRNGRFEGGRGDDLKSVAFCTPCRDSM